MSNAQAHAQAVLDDLVGRGIERGLQVAAILDGQLVVDAWSGEGADGRPVNGDSLFVAYSCTKGVAATVVHLLAERGQLDYDVPIARYWPEFASGPAAEVKATITVRQALCHTAGMLAMPPDTSLDTLAFPERLAEWVVRSEPLWTPGTMTGYHAITLGTIVAEVVRRIDGRTLGRIVAEDISRPLGISDSLFVGLRNSAAGRVVVQESAPPNPNVPAPPPDALIFKAIPMALYPLHRVSNDRRTWTMELPASGGIMSARALARMYAALMGEPVDGGRRLLSAGRIATATQVQTADVDVALGTPTPKMLGWFGGYAGSSMSASATAFGHPGAGGSTGFADPATGFAMALTKTRLVTPDAPEQGSARVVEREIRDALGMRT